MRRGILPARSPDWRMADCEALPSPLRGGPGWGCGRQSRKRGADTPTSNSSPQRGGEQRAPWALPNGATSAPLRPRRLYVPGRHALRGVLTCGHAHAFSHFLLNSTLPDPLIAPHVQRARSATCRETAFPHWVPACLVNRSRVSHNAAQRWYKWLPGGRKREQVYRRWHVLCAQPI